MNLEIPEGVDLERGALWFLVGVVVHFLARAQLDGTGLGAVESGIDVIVWTLLYFLGIGIAVAVPLWFLFSRPLLRSAEKRAGSGVHLAEVIPVVIIVLAVLTAGVVLVAPLSSPDEEAGTQATTGGGGGTDAVGSGPSTSAVGASSGQLDGSIQNVSVFTKDSSLYGSIRAFRMHYTADVFEPTLKIYNDSGLLTKTWGVGSSPAMITMPDDVAVNGGTVTLRLTHQNSELANTTKTIDGYSLEVSDVSIKFPYHDSDLDSYPIRWIEFQVTNTGDIPIPEFGYTFKRIGQSRAEAFADSRAQTSLDPGESTTVRANVLRSASTDAFAFELAVWRRGIQLDEVRDRTTNHFAEDD